MVSIAFLDTKSPQITKTKNKDININITWFPIIENLKETIQG